MTLDTRIYVHDPVDIDDLFVFCQELTGSSNARVERRDGRVMNEPGQGFPAWLRISFGMDGPLRTPADQAQCDDCADGCGGDHSWKYACWAEVSFDTAYGYHDDQGRSCGMLHAEYVVRLGAWLDSLGVRWEWEDEFTGEIHSGLDRIHELTSHTPSAQEWYRCDVLPAILADVASKS